jgi:hypothetical protein
MDVARCNTKWSKVTQKISVVVTLNKLDEDDISLKREKFFTPLSGEADLNGRNGQLMRSPLVISDNGEYDSPNCISNDNYLASISVSTSRVSETVPREI